MVGSPAHSGGKVLSTQLILVGEVELTFGMMSKRNLSSVKGKNFVMLMVIYLVV